MKPRTLPARDSKDSGTVVARARHRSPYYRYVAKTRSGRIASAVVQLRREESVFAAAAAHRAPLQRYRIGFAQCRTRVAERWSQFAKGLARQSRRQIAWMGLGLLTIFILGGLSTMGVRSATAPWAQKSQGPDSEASLVTVLDNDPEDKEGGEDTDNISKTQTIPSRASCENSLRRLAMGTSMHSRAQINAKKIVRLKAGTRVIVYSCFPAPTGWFLGQRPGGDVGFMLTSHLGIEGSVSAGMHK